MRASLLLNAASTPVALLILCSLAAAAADVDESLVDRLETAKSGRDQYDILDTIAQRIAVAPFSTELTERLIAELMSKETYNLHHIMRVLPQIAGDRGFSDQSLLYLARALSGEMTRSYDPAVSIARILSSVHERSGLSNEAFGELINALDHRAMLNRSAAIDVLAVTRADDGRYATSVNSIFSVLTEHDHQHTRSSAIAALGRLTRNQLLPPNVLQGLVRAATTDPYMTVRMDALDLLAGRDIDVATRTALSSSLAAEIISPTPEIWARSSGLRAHDELADRATAVMEKLHGAPYPDHVIDAWIAQTTGDLPERSLAALRRVFLRGELSNSQISRLTKIAEARRVPGEREMIYATLYVQMQAETLREALVGFENADDEAVRIRAGYALKEQYRAMKVPDHVAAVAARVVIDGNNVELRAIAADLLAHAQRDPGLSERRLIAAAQKHQEDHDIHSAIIDLYGPDRIEDLVIKYASDTELSVSFRRSVIQELGHQKISDTGLSPGSENTLKEVARNAEDYYLVQDVGDTLRAWGIRPPLRVAFKNRANQSKALFVILVGLIIINLAAAIIALFGVFKLPIKSEKNRVAIRTGLFVAWLALFAVILVLLGAGAIGFLGHNSLPSPKATLLWNLPAYGGTVTVVFLTWLIWRRARQVTNTDLI